MRIAITRRQLTRIGRSGLLLYVAPIALFTLFLQSTNLTQGTTQAGGKTKVVRIDQQSEWRAHGVKAEVLDYKGKPAVRVTDAAPTPPTENDCCCLQEPISGME